MQNFFRENKIDDIFKSIKEEIYEMFEQYYREILEKTNSEY